MQKMGLFTTRHFGSDCELKSEICPYMMLILGTNSEAKLGSIHSKDIFDEGLKIAKRQESLFKAHVAEEKEKDLAHQLNQLR
jgi:hypothetical protein